MAGNTQRDERGIALIVALMILLVLTLIGISAIGTATFENRISGNERLGNNAFYAAEAGIEVGFNRLPDVSSFSGTVGDVNYQSGTFSDSTPQRSTHLGKTTVPPGFSLDSDGGYDAELYQASATGTYFSARKGIEVQVRYVHPK